MSKELPKVFHNKIDKDFNNNNKFYYSANKTESPNNDLTSENDIDIKKKINEIFSSNNYIYKAEVIIKTKDNSYDTKIIGRNKFYLITMDNKKIPINDIISIKRKNSL